jgi:dUTP pyrophosphatase
VSAFIRFHPLYPDVVPPERATEGSAGYDLKACLRAATVRYSDGQRQWDVPVTGDDGSAPSITLDPGLMALVPLGFKAQLPEGIEAQVRPRSGAAFKQGLHVANAPGTIDCDYPGEWLVPVRNASAGPLRIAHVDRIAQMVLARYQILEFREGQVGVSSSRTDGFGSTGR